ncbi:MAG: flagellar biosynthetic protein FliO [Desulfuromonadaceae bacterium]
MKTLWLTFFTLLPLPALAADDTPGLLAAWTKMIIALLVVLGIILLLYALSRKGFGLFPAAKTGTIKILEMRSLGPKKGLCLIRVREEEFLLGLGNDRVELIAQITRPQTSFDETLQTRYEEELP